MKPSNELIKAFVDEQGNLRKVELDDFYKSMLNDNRKKSLIAAATDFMINELKITDLLDLVKNIYPLMFVNANYLDELAVHEDIELIGDQAFYGSSIKRVDASKPGLKALGDSAFESSTLSEIQLGDGLESIGANCFNGCPMLESIIIPANVKVIKTGAFRDSGIKQVICNAQDITIETATFTDAQYLESVKFAEGSRVEIKSGAFVNNGALKEVNFPAKGEVLIGQRGFYNYSDELKLVLHTSSKIKCPQQAEPDLYTPAGNHIVREKD